jgi:hypothetical protein
MVDETVSNDSTWGMVVPWKHPRCFAMPRFCHESTAIVERADTVGNHSRLIHSRLPTLTLSHECEGGVK